MSALRSSAGPAVWTKATLELGRDDLRQRRLAEAGRPGEQHVVERLAARAGGLRSRRRAAPCSASWPTNSSSRRGRSEPSSVVLGARRPARLDAARRSPPRLAQRVGDQVLGRLAGRAVEQLVGLLRREAEPDAARRGRAAAGRRRAATDDRVAGRARRRPSRAARRRSAPPCACRCPARPAGARCRRRRPRRAARAAGRRESTASATFGPTDCTPISSRKRSRSSSVAKP